MKNILITGASGYLGSQLVKKLEEREDTGSIVGIDIVPPAYQHKKLVFFKKDIRDPEIGNILFESRIDTVFHFAFVVKPIHDLRRMHDIDYRGTNNILTKCAENNVKHIIASGSTLAYGAHKYNFDALSEENPLMANKSFPYGYNKAITDMMMQDFAKAHPETTLTILRPCTVFGPSVDNYVSRMLFMPAAVTVLGYNPAVQFLHEDDFVKSCLVAMEKQKAGAFNITGDGTVTIQEIAGLTGARLIPVPAFVLYPLLELLWAFRVPGIEVNSGYLNYVRYPFIANNQKAKEFLGFYPEFTSRKTLEDTARNKSK